MYFFFVFWKKEKKNILSLLFFICSQSSRVSHFLSRVYPNHTTQYRAPSAQESRSSAAAVLNHFICYCIILFFIVINFFIHHVSFFFFCFYFSPPFSFVLTENNDSLSFNSIIIKPFYPLIFEVLKPPKEYYKKIKQKRTLINNHNFYFLLSIKLI